MPRQALEIEAEDAVKRALGYEINVHSSDVAALGIYGRVFVPVASVCREVILRRLHFNKLSTLRWLRRKHLL